MSSTATTTIRDIPESPYASGRAAAPSLARRTAWAAAAIGIGVVIAGFWNPKLVDGFGRGVVAAHTIGNTHSLSTSFATNGVWFGLLFGLVAGLAATFTACNCVVFAILPGLACETNAKGKRPSLLRTILPFVAAVVGVGAIYGALVGGLGPHGVAHLNSIPVRLPQAELVFTFLGLILLTWGAIEFGFLSPLTTRLRSGLRHWLGATRTRMVLAGLVVGLFAVGRPYPVFRDLLTYAAQAHNPVFGAVVLAIQGLGQIALMVVLLFLVVRFAGDAITRWLQSNPARLGLLTAVTLTAGGSYLVYYWGLALVFGIGSWGFKLGIYS